MSISKRLTLGFALIFMHTSLSFAGKGGDNKPINNNSYQAIVAKVITAYGGEHFRNIKSLQLTDEYNAFRGGQSYRPDAADIVDNRYTLTLDYVERKNNFQWRYGSSDSFSIQHQQFNGIKGLRYFHNDKTYVENSNISFASADRRHQLLLDTNLALLLTKSADKAQYIGSENLRGKMHAKIFLAAENHPEMTLYINEETGLISQMQRKHWRSEQGFIYQYRNPTSVNNIVYAQDFYVTRGGEPFSASINRNIVFNLDTSNAFISPKNYQLQPPTMDLSAMTVKKIANNLYLSGERWGFSIFYDAGDYFVAAGGYEGISKRFKALKEFANLNKPLKYMVVSHHHFDHIGGVKEAESMGVTFVTVENNINIINQFVGKTLPKERFLVVNEQASFANNKVQVFDNPNGHANHNLITYINSAELIFTADTYFSRQESGSPNGSDSLKGFKRKLDSTGVSVKYLAAAHSSRVLSYQDLLQSLKSSAPPTVCPNGWTICRP